MLKALELHGFKSFADKTRFEFPDGITVVVGPNGSGKSNVVDAIKWVLGEQSAKSLRGAEMSDVIFKGSGNGQRKPANTASVTIVFDNSRSQLDVESEDVRVTRRVYRSGEGEYLINDEPCRLRDIRDLFRGTGVGTDAYSLIEQGKIDNLLQASPRERRAIFEEAAGISRFKAKKVESQRRLERVDQNLLRLSDIVEEVEKRLKSLQNQATKARRYKEHTDRLKQLRTHVGLSDYREINEACSQLEAELSTLSAKLATIAASNQQSEHDLTDLDSRMSVIQTESRLTDQSLSKCREVIASQETTTQFHRKTLVELESEKARYRHRLTAVHSQAGDGQVQLEQVRNELAAVEDACKTADAKARQAEAEVGALNQKLQANQLQAQDLSQRHAEQLKSSALLSSQLNRLESELELAISAISRDEVHNHQLQQQLAASTAKQRDYSDREQTLRAELDEATEQQESAQAEFDAASTNLSDLRERLSNSQQNLAIASERSKVLEEIERKLEGVSAGTKDLLSQARNNMTGPFGEIRGMVADLIEVQVDMAPVIDAALGERSQFIVVAGQRMIRSVSAGTLRLRGRVGFISLSSLVAHQTTKSPMVDHQSIVGFATEFVKVDTAWNELVEFLLGNTWIVKSLDAALDLREQLVRSTASPRLVSLAGEVIESDGTVFGGPRQHSSGIVSRRSELRSLRSQIQHLSGENSLLQQQAATQQATAAECEQRLRKWTAVRKEKSEAYADVHATAEASRQIVAQTQATQEALQAGISELQQRRQELTHQQSDAQSGLHELSEHVAKLEQQLGEHQVEIANLETLRRTKEEQFTAAQIARAKVDQQAETLRIQALRCEQDTNERNRSLADLSQQLQQCLERQKSAERDILAATSQLAERYLEQESDQSKLNAFILEQDHILAQRETIVDKAKQLRKQLHTVEQSRHAVQLQVGELRLKRDSVSERVRDDYGIELAEIRDELAEQGEREEVDREIGELRRKISNIGAVNMESLAELEDLEERFASLSGQHEDLVQAKQTLERIIQRINTDSRRMFLETLSLIRNSFQILFRRAFGGGHADIVVEEDVDVLDSGIDIVATPPGKHSLNISLLSGGERALTAVTLLLAIFRYRPSPFCVLDEVDGPLDEANIGRFVDVLNEFLEHTKIVIVTHSKKTMSASDTLYGITMQESGVSKRVSVQFNDVREDGSIREGLESTDDSSDGEAA